MTGAGFAARAKPDKIGGFSPGVPMHVRDAVLSRYSCRAFLPTPVPESVVRDILEAAARAPSGGNVQPWRVDVLAGARLAALIDALAPRMAELPVGEGQGYEIFPKHLPDPWMARRVAVGEQLYAAIGVPRADKPARYRQYARNFAFFGAPVGMFVSVPRLMGPPQWSDVGMFIQNILLLARGNGLHSCAQEAWTIWHRTVSTFLALPEDHLLFCGIALGHADPDAPINHWRSPRVPVDGFATFQGFG